MSTISTTRDRHINIVLELSVALKSMEAKRKTEALLIKLAKDEIKKSKDKLQPTFKNKNTPLRHKHKVGTLAVSISSSKTKNDNDISVSFKITPNPAAVGKDYINKITDGSAFLKTIMEKNGINVKAYLAKCNQTATKGKGKSKDIQYQPDSIGSVDIPEIKSPSPEPIDSKKSKITQREMSNSEDEEDADDINSHSELSTDEDEENDDGSDLEDFITDDEEEEEDVGDQEGDEEEEEEEETDNEDSSSDSENSGSSHDSDDQEEQKVKPKHKQKQKQKNLGNNPEGEINNNKDSDIEPGM